MSNQQITRILEKITQNKEFKEEIHDILQKTYSGRAGGGRRMRYEDCSIGELKGRAARRKIMLPAGASKSTIIATLRRHN